MFGSGPPPPLWQVSFSPLLEYAAVVTTHGRSVGAPITCTLYRVSCMLQAHMRAGWQCSWSASTSNHVLHIHLWHVPVVSCRCSVQYGPLADAAITPAALPAACTSCPWRTAPSPTAAAALRGVAQPRHRRGWCHLRQTARRAMRQWTGGGLSCWRWPARVGQCRWRACRALQGPWPQAPSAVRPAAGSLHAWGATRGCWCSSPCTSSSGSRSRHPSAPRGRAGWDWQAQAAAAAVHKRGVKLAAGGCTYWRSARHSRWCRCVLRLTARHAMCCSALSGRRLCSAGD